MDRLGKEGTSGEGRNRKGKE
jgi:hypothetical protein